MSKNIGSDGNFVSSDENSFSSLHFHFSSLENNFSKVRAEVAKIGGFGGDFVEKRVFVANVVCQEFLPLRGCTAHFDFLLLFLRKNDIMGFMFN